ncbi:MAG: DinB family protein [Planctomycetaceae bacterium]|nr:DinB family protein [Planctomycetaceae bacterium]
MSLAELSVAQLIEEYLKGPKLLRDAVGGMTHEQLLARPIAGKWSTLEVIAHLADFEPVYGDRMKRILAENEPTLFGGDPDKFAAKLAYHGRDLETELCLIECVRKQMAAILQTVPDSDFERVGQHCEAGPLTLRTFLERITGHIPHHLPFIAEKRRALATS